MIIGNVTINYNATHITSNQNITLAPDVIENDAKYYIGSYEYTVLKNGSPAFSVGKIPFSMDPILVNQSSFISVSSLGLTPGNTVQVNLKFWAVHKTNASELSYNFSTQVVTYDPNIQATNYIKVSRRKRNIAQLPSGSVPSGHLDTNHGTYSSTKDSDHVIAPVPDILRDDGSVLRIHKDHGPYWSRIIGGLDINYTYRLYYTHGYTLGGYKDSSAFRSVYKTIHNQGTNSVTTFVGNVLHQVNAYAGGTWGDRYAYVYKARTDGSGGAFYSSNGITKFDMASETSVRDPASFRSTYTHSAASVVNNFGLFGYIASGGSGGQIEEHDLTTDVLSPLGQTVPTNGVNCSTGKEAGYFYSSSGLNKLVFATKTVVSTGISVAAGAASSSCLPTKRYYHYHDISSSSLVKVDELTETVTGSASKTYGFFEESWQMGEDNGFSVGVYGTGGQNREIHVMNLDTSSMSLRGSAPGNVAGLSTAANVSAAGSLYASLFPNYSLTYFALV